MSNKKSVAIIEDDQDHSNVLVFTLEDAGFNPKQIENKQYSEVSELVHIISNEADYAICDHRLTWNNYAQFSGAELVFDLYDRQIPSILTSNYTTIDINTKIRKYLINIPVLLHSDRCTEDEIVKGFDLCEKEFNNEVSTQRRPHKSLLLIENVEMGLGEKLIEVFIPSLTFDERIQFPINMVQESLRESVLKGARLFAEINIGANKSDEVFLKNFELAPEPGDLDGLLPTNNY